MVHVPSAARPVAGGKKRPALRVGHCGPSGALHCLPDATSIALRTAPARVNRYDPMKWVAVTEIWYKSTTGESDVHLQDRQWPTLPIIYRVPIEIFAAAVSVAGITGLTRLKFAGNRERRPVKRGAIAQGRFAHNLWPQTAEASPKGEASTRERYYRGGGVAVPNASCSFRRCYSAASFCAWSHIWAIWSPSMEMAWPTSRILLSCCLLASESDAVKSMSILMCAALQLAI